MVGFGPVVSQNVTVGNMGLSRAAYLMVTGKHREEGAGALCSLQGHTSSGLNSFY